jgi:nitroreductase
MDAREVLYTTRAMRRVKPDPIPEDVIGRILDAAIRAPSGGNAQSWKFVVIDDRDQIAKLAPIYHDAMEKLWASFYKEQIEAAMADPDDPEHAQWLKVYRSASWLQDNFAQVPLLLFGFGGAGDVYPALWSAQLAARAEGVGSAFTSVLSFLNRDEVLAVLGTTAEASGPLLGCITFGYPLGRWGVAKRTPINEVMFRNTWGNPLGIDVAGALWPES